MNANKLANALVEMKGYYGYNEQAATMLRQQQAEIEALKKEAALQRLSDFTQEAESFDRTASHMAGEYVSYPVKELTDEELDILWDETFPNTSEMGYTGRRRLFARAILRKAQET
jgi:hypothetical protein